MKNEYLFKVENETSLCNWNDLFEFIDSEAKNSKKIIQSELNLSDYKKSIENKNYTTLLNQRISNESDLVRVMCIAYSWMPTMLDIHLDDARTAIILNGIKSLKSIDLESNEELILISELSKAANNSLVGAIKTLHLINPSRFPLIDSRVLIAWKRLMKVANDFMQIEPLVYSWNIGSKQENLKKLILKYFYYRSFIFHWVSQLDKGITVRDIEFRLYLMGDKSE